MEIRFDFDRELGRVREMHGVGGAPFTGVDASMMRYLKEAGVPYSRLHDIGGRYGGNVFVDIHNVFRDFDADPEDEGAYDFTFTDWLLRSLKENGVEPIYRLGETIENYHYVKAYRIFPPKDPMKWARICEHVIKHYNYGWADGFRYGIKYWEIWNEPDNGRDDSENQMWHGTPEQFYELYTVAAKHLKSVFGDEIMVGGYATCGFRYILSCPEKYGVELEPSDDSCYASGRSKNFLEFFEGFFEHIKREGAPLDFFSWHSYLTTDRTVALAGYLERRLCELGYGGIPTQLNEWNNVCEDRGNPLDFTEMAKKQRGTALAAAKTLSMMCGMQNTRTELLCYYDAQLGTSFYRAMFDPIKQTPEPLYYAFVAFNELYKLGTQVAATSDCEGAEQTRHYGAEGVYYLAAKGEGGRAAVIVNTGSAAASITTNFDSGTEARLLAQGHSLDGWDIDPTAFTLPAESFVLIKGE